MRRTGSVSDEELQAAVRSALAATDEKFLASYSSDAGTTVVLAAACGARVLIASIGDSYAIMCTRRSTCSTEDSLGEAPPAEWGVSSSVLSALHSPDRPDEARRIAAAGGFVKTTAG